METNVLSSCFYGKKQRDSKLISAIENRQNHYKENPLPEVWGSSIAGETEIWQIFFTQDEALNFVLEKGMNLKVFSFESVTLGGNGKRKFVCCHPTKLWKTMQCRSASKRFMYEVIPEGAVCKLYFDLEFSQELNGDLDGCKIVTNFIKIVNFFIRKIFSVDFTINDILNLDSSSEKKFSCHLIYCNKLVFTDNKQAGYFVNFLCTKLRKAHQFKTLKGSELEEMNDTITYDDINSMFVKNSSHNFVLFCDEGVYTKNRNFRTFGSCKKSKGIPLTLSNLNKYTPLTGNSDANYFLDSLITWISKDIKIVKFENENSQYQLPESNISKIKPSFLKKDARSEKKSPYTEIEKYFEDLIGENCISSWTYNAETETLFFSIAKDFNYCQNINRHHKSNCIYYIIDLKKGIYYQKCFDPDCKLYKSPAKCLPPQTMPWLALAEDDDEEFILLEAVRTVENSENI